MQIRIQALDIVKWYLITRTTSTERYFIFRVGNFSARKCSSFGHSMEAKLHLSLQAISIIEPEVIERRQPQTMADALGLSGKVFIQKSQQGGGSADSWLCHNRLLYSVDGIR